MLNNPFNKKPVQHVNKENCKIKIRHTKTGKEISFSGNCSKEQLNMAKNGFSDESMDVDEEDYND